MNRQLTFAIDFDDTLTACPELWFPFIDKAIADGHAVLIITARRATEENRADIKEYLIEHGHPSLYVVYTNLGSKLDYVKKQNIKVDIWIDDDPHSLVHGR